MTCSHKRIRLCAVLLICNLIFIWGNSLMTAEISTAFSSWVKDLLSWLLPGSSSGGPGQAEDDTLLRKIAHFTEFASLGFLLSWLFAMLQKGKIRPFLCGVTAACLDETIQAFVPGRAPGVLDVLLDTCGVGFGMVLLYLGHTYFKRKQTKIFGG